MANRRMFSLLIIDTDMFLDMPLSAQALYFHLSMRADDDGFVGNVKKIRRMIGASEDDLKILLAKKFVIQFETGVCVIKHWRIHNYIQKDRYSSSIYSEEKKQLKLDNNKTYQVKNDCDLFDVNDMDTECIQDVSSLDTQVRLGKDSIGKNSIDNNNNNNKLNNNNKGKKRIETEIKDLNLSENLTKALLDFSEMRKTIKKPLTKKALTLLISKLDKIANNEQEKIEILNNSVMNCWQGVFPLKPKQSNSNTKIFGKGEEDKYIDNIGEW